MIIAGFAGNTDLSRAQEIANEVRRVIKNLKECQQLSQLYNQRERLFGLSVTQVMHILDKLIGTLPTKLYRLTPITKVALD